MSDLNETNRLGVDGAWKIGRALIEHEDKLTHERLKLVVAFDGFLVAALAFVIGDVEGRAVSFVVAAGICVLGMVTSIPFIRSDILSAKFRRHLSSWWEDGCKDASFQYPSICAVRARISTACPFLAPR